MLRIGLAMGHDSCILSAFGCGAFRNPPETIARVFRTVLGEEGMIDAQGRWGYKIVIFAIFDDERTRMPHNPNGNLEPFRAVFSDMAG